MKILQINSVYKTGSTGRIVQDIHTELLQNKQDSLVIYGRGESPCLPNIYRFNSNSGIYLHVLLARLTGLNGCFSNRATHKIIKLIQKEKPDIVHLHNLHGYYLNLYRLLRFLKKQHSKTVITLHDEFMYTGNCAYTMNCRRYEKCCRKCKFRYRYPKSYINMAHLLWKKKKKVYQNFDTLYLATNSRWLSHQLQTTILKSIPVTVVHNGINTDIFYPREIVKIKNLLPTGSRGFALAISDDFYDKRKGLDFLIELAIRNQDINFIIVGCKEKLDYSNVTTIPLIKNVNDLAELYSAADVLVITSICDTFPTVCIESLACGTPIVGFRTGGTPETAPGKLGIFVPFGDLKELEKALLHMMQEKVRISSACRKYAVENYSLKAMTNRYLELYYHIMKGSDNN